MREEQVILNGAAQKRAMALMRVVSGEWTAAEAAVSLALSERQARRLVRAYVAGGPAALVHGNQGRKPAHALSEEVRAGDRPGAWQVRRLQ